MADIVATIGETITLFVEVYDAMPSKRERAEAGVDESFILHSKHRRLIGTAPIVAACYGDNKEKNWFTNPNGTGELVITVEPGSKTLTFTMVIGNSPYTLGYVKQRLPDGTTRTLTEASADYPRAGVTIEGRP